jgi:hypothetical protein
VIRCTPMIFPSVHSKYGMSNHGMCSGLFLVVKVMQTNPRSAVEHAARELLSCLSEYPVPPALRVVEIEGRMACLILVWDAAKEMPTIRAERRRQSGGARATCKADIVDVIRAANQPLTRKEVIQELRKARKHHGRGTVAKALADLTAAGELSNPKDKKGYRMPEWLRKQKTPSLFD